MAEKGKSGRSSPSHSLEQAVGLIRDLRDAVGTGPASRDFVAKGLGHSSGKSGAVSIKIGSLTHFGLLELAGTSQYKVSDLALRILMPGNEAERIQAVAESAKEPALYRDLLNRFGGQSLPQMLPNILVREFRVAENKAGEVAGLFEATMQYAGLLRQGVMHNDHGEGSVEAQGQAPEPAMGKEAPASDAPGLPGATPGSLQTSVVRSPARPGGQEFHILLRGKRVACLQLPADFDGADLDNIGSWLELNKRVLDEESEPRE